MSILTEKFGVMGAQYFLMAHGVDNSDVYERSETKSIGRETTFEEDTGDREAVMEALGKLQREVIGELEEEALLFKTVTVKIRYENFETHTHARTLHFYTASAQSLQKTALELIQSYIDRNRKIRLVGIRVSNFVSREEQRTLA